MIWDLAGNVWEWTSYFNDEEKPTPVGHAWDEFTDLTGTSTMPLTDLIPQVAIDNTWNSIESIGQYYPGNDASGGALPRGGDWNDTSYAGVFIVRLNYSTEANGEISKILMYVDLSIDNIEEVHRSRPYGNHKFYRHHEFSFGGDSGTCKGDSGGPAYVLEDGRLNLIGITNRGPSRGSGGVFKATYDQTDWIGCAFQQLGAPPLAYLYVNYETEICDEIFNDKVVEAIESGERFLLTGYRGGDECPWAGYSALKASDARLLDLNDFYHNHMTYRFYGLANSNGVLERGTVG